MPFRQPAVTFPAKERHRPLTDAKLYCLVTEAHRCEQLAKGCYAALNPRPIVASPTSHRYAIMPPCYQGA